MSDSSGFPESPPEFSSSSSCSSASNLDDGIGSRSSRSCCIPDLMHCNASTMSPLSRLRHFDIVMPPCENAHSMETDNDMTARLSCARDAHMLRQYALSNTAPKLYIVDSERC